MIKLWLKAKLALGFNNAAYTNLATLDKLCLFQINFGYSE